MDLRILAITLPLLALILAVSIWRKSFGRDWTAIAGLACTLIGDYFLAMNRAPRDSREFVYGVIGFSLTHGFWMAHLLRGKRLPQLPVILGLLTPLLPYLYCRVLPNAVPHVGMALVAYTVLSCLSLSCAVASGKPLWCLSIGALFISDFFISLGTFTDEPHLGRYVVRTYVLALCASALATIFPKPTFPLPYRSMKNRKTTLLLTLVLYVASVTCFVLAMTHTPGGSYNPLRQMLSYLGRREVDGVLFPACHYLFVLGMFFSALAFAVASPHLADLTPWKHLRWLAELAAGMTAAGLVLIALLPEDVNITWHCYGCDVAAIAGSVFILVLRPRRWQWLLVGELFCVAAGFATCLALHDAGKIPFSPSIPTFQKALILSFMAWGVWQCIRAFATTLPPPKSKQLR
jgi:hypothetical protein